MLLTAGVVATSTAQAATCGAAVPYPGDKATSEQYANWLGNGAYVAGLPAELPVMAALVESGLRNLNYGDADSVGFFQMRTSIWNKGKYKGYLKKPDLQLQWFVDTAASVRAGYIKNGKGDPASTLDTFGVWIADVERPAAQYRGRYQLRLADAQALVKATCPGLIGTSITAPKTSLLVKSVQHPARSSRVEFSLRCPKVSCTADATVMFRLPGRRKLVKLHSPTAMLEKGARTPVRISVKRSMRTAIRKRLARGQKTRTVLRVRVTGPDGATATRERVIRIAR
jgi:hypothetical protein